MPTGQQEFLEAVQVRMPSFCSSKWVCIASRARFVNTSVLHALVTRRSCTDRSCISANKSERAPDIHCLEAHATSSCQARGWYPTLVDWHAGSSFTTTTSSSRSHATSSRRLATPRMTARVGPASTGTLSRQLLVIRCCASDDGCPAKRQCHVQLRHKLCAGEHCDLLQTQEYTCILLVQAAGRASKAVLQGRDLARAQAQGCRNAWHGYGCQGCQRVAVLHHSGVKSRRAFRISALPTLCLLLCGLSGQALSTVHSKLCTSCRCLYVFNRQPRLLIGLVLQGRGNTSGWKSCREHA